MKWDIIAIERLKDYEKRKRAIENIPEQIRILELRYTALKSSVSNLTPVKNSGNNIEEMLLYNISKREELSNSLKLAKREVTLTEKGLAVLTETEKRILHLFYIDRPKDYIKRLCDELFLSRPELYRAKDKALRKFIVAEYGIVDL